MKISYKNPPVKYVDATNRSVAFFPVAGKNIDEEVVTSFGEEWTKFNEFSDETIDVIAREYFDIINEEMVNKNTYALDIGCGTGRWTKYLSQKAGFIEAIDPSNAIFAADKLLAGIENVRLTRASTETIPFEDGTFDFAMSVGVLHHIPNTRAAMQDCVKKVKTGGYFYCYIYHNLEARGGLFRFVFQISDLIRKVVCRLPAGVKRFVCDILAVIVYMPFILWVRFLKFIGMKKLAKLMPLEAYGNKPFFIIRNDALDKFGTRLEQRFSKKQIEDMMKECGLDDIIISPNSPFYHAVGKKIR